MSSLHGRGRANGHEAARLTPENESLCRDFHAKQDGVVIGQRAASVTLTGPLQGAEEPGESV